MPPRRNTNRKPNPAKVGRRRRARVKAPGTSANPSALNSIVRSICSITDPFCHSAYGAKVPDGATSRSLATTYETTIPIFTNSQGDGAVLVTPSFWTPGVQATSLAGGIASFPLGSPYVQSYDTDVTRWRMVSFGVEVQSITSSMTNQGMVYIRTFSPVVYDTLSTVPYATYRADSFKDIPVRSCREKVISKRLGTEATLFHSPASQMGTTLVGEELPGFQAIVVAVEGAEPTATVLRLRIVRHLEYVPADGTVSYTFASNSPMPNLAVIQQSNTVMGTVGNYLGERASEVIHSAAGKSVVRSALTWGASSLANYMFGPAAGAVTGLLTNSAMEVD